MIAAPTATRAPKLDMHKMSQVRLTGETAVATIRCNTPWQLDDSGLSSEASGGGRLVAEGTPRP